MSSTEPKRSSTNWIASVLARDRDAAHLRDHVQAVLDDVDNHDLLNAFCPEVRQHAKTDGTGTVDQGTLPRLRLGGVHAVVRYRERLDHSRCRPLRSMGVSCHPESSTANFLSETFSIPETTGFVVDRRREVRQDGLLDAQFQDGDMIT
ncbi:hypothetical protein RKD54_004576 [Pseudarthrobacter sp. SLBN-100]|uniref:hypothetical protein n=1 Tax=Arthrobacter sp. SLBN-100 TaxID=2768450 RepID=UPI001357EC6F|nr:hypothetical protein [Arthrobacter sp. SLBN-100]